MPLASTVPKRRWKSGIIRHPCGCGQLEALARHETKAHTEMTPMSYPNRKPIEHLCFWVAMSANIPANVVEINSQYTA